MSYVGEPFQHDLFVSYSHGDDGEGGGHLQPWSAAFTRALERELKVDRKFRNTLRVFLDKDHRPGAGVDPMIPLPHQLCEQIGAAAVLVVLMSPDYLASLWCAREREWWCERQPVLGLPTEGRIAVVQILPTEDAWPEPLSDPSGVRLPGFAFHATVEGVARPLGWTETPDYGPEYRNRLLGIVGRVSGALETVQMRIAERRRQQAEAERLTRAAAEPRAVAAEGSEFTVYLHGRADHARPWERAATALLDLGFAVVPGEPDTVPRDASLMQKARAQRVQTLSACDALLLVGAGDGQALDHDLLVVGRHDRQSARAQTSRLLPCGVLDMVGPPVANPVRKATARILQAEWIDGTRDPWTPAVKAWLADRGARAGMRQ